MTVRIGVIGNSHLAAFKTGWPLIADEHPDKVLTFFGATRSKLRAIRAKKGSLVPTTVELREELLWTSGGLDHIPGNLDAYIVVGAGISFPHMLATLRTHCPFHLYQADMGATQLISEVFFLAGLRDRVERSAASRVVGELQSVTRAPVIMTPCPYLAKGAFTHPQYFYCRSEDARKYIFSAYRQLLHDFQDRCTVALQPEESIEDGMFTRDEYSHGSIQLRKGMLAHKDDDHHHMNADFGALCLRHILADLTRAAPVPGSAQKPITASSEIPS